MDVTCRTPSDCLRYCINRSTAGVTCFDDRLVEARAIGRGVVEAMFACKTVLLVVGKAGLFGRRDPQRVHLVKLIGEHIALIEIRRSPRAGTPVHVRRDWPT